VPTSEVARVTREVAATLQGWNVGPSTTVVCGGARGADIIVAEQARELGARVRLCLAAPAEEFEANSVGRTVDVADHFRGFL
jgi:predicted Rossmann-fold nucleotide-binding protein